MIILFPKKENDDAMKECPVWEKPADWPFMEKSGEVLKNMPNTWKQYPATEEGMIGIIDMEYGELKRAATIDDISQELIHLSTACLRLWRKLNNVK